MKLRNRFGVRYPTAPGLVLDLPFSERSGSKVYDRSGKDNHGVIHGATWTVSERGSVLSFDGDNDYVDCGNGASLNITDAITIDVWIKPSVSSDDFIFSKIGDPYPLQYYTYFGVNMAMGISTSSTGWSKTATKVGALSNEWHHVVFVFSPSIYIKFYVDGALYYTDTTGIPASIYSDASTTLVLNWSHVDKFYQSTIDQVHIYNRVLGAEEIKRRYEQSKYDYLRSK